MADPTEVVSVLADLTGQLQPTAGGRSADLAKVRRLLANSLARGQTESTRGLPSIGAAGHAVANLKPELTEALREESAAAIAAAEREPGAHPTSRVFRRELPFITSQVPGSVPAWAAGLARTETIGPFLDELGRPVWFDVIHSVRLTQLVRAPGGPPILVLPLRGPLAARTRYKVPAGSLWLNSRLLAASAPSGGWSGIRISGGTLEIDASPTLVGDTLQIPAGAKATLVVTLEPPAAAVPVNGPGVDAGQATVALPKTATFVCSPAGISVSAADPAQLSVYGTAAPMIHAPGPATFEPALNRVLVPFAAEIAGFAVTDCRSTLWNIGGRAPIIGAAWALPVAVIDPIALGEAAGAGALVLRVGAGLSATWTTLDGGQARLNETFIMAEPGRIAVTAVQARHRRGEHRLRLWQGTDPARFASLGLRYGPPFPLRYFAEQSGSEAVATVAHLTANLDRPVKANGQRFDLRNPAALAIFGQQPAGSTILVWAQPSTTHTAESTALALRNALICVNTTDALILFGTLASDGAVGAGGLMHWFVVRRIVPTLPDPYVANLLPPIADREHGTLSGSLLSIVRWPSPERPDLSFRLSGGRFATPAPSTFGIQGDKAYGAAGGADVATTRFLGNLVAEGGQGRRLEDETRIARLEALFDKWSGASRDALVMLDVSSNADQFGIGFNVTVDQRPATSVGAAPTPTAAEAPVQIVGIDLVSFGRNVRLLTAPAISWEPVTTLPDPAFPFPPVLASANDGSPTRLGVNSVALVPIAPVPALDHLIKAYTDPADPRPVAAMLTLPFGMRAVATLQQATYPTEGPTLDFVKPRFLEEDTHGGLQLRLTAGPQPDSADDPSPSFPGATIQTRNGTTIGGLPLFISVLGGGGGSPVETIFNNEFEPGSSRAQVPVTRYDISGYGASVFSDWTDPNAAFALTSQVRFDVFVGRTAYEVVQVKSYLYPWGVPVVRTITMERHAGGAVIRKDSGWQAMAPGTFQFPVAAGEEAIRVGPLHIHPGVVHGVFNVRNIRDTPRAFETPIDGGARLVAVTFDADVHMERIRRGGKDDFVPTRGQLGFVQIEPAGAALTRRQLRALMEAEGPLGGPVDCAMDVGGSGLVHRVTRVDVGLGLDGFNEPVFAAAARGGPVLPKAGAWSVVRTVLSTGETSGVDPNGASPLVRAGDARPATVPTGPFRFADPADVLNENDPASDYGFLHATGTQRVLYRRPKIEPGQTRLTSTQRPLVADTWSLLRASGIFPKAADCLEVPTTAYNLEVYPDAEGELKLNLPFAAATFALDPTLTRTLAEVAQTRTFAQYADVTGAPTQVTLTFDSRATDPWTFAMRPQSLVVTNGGEETFRFHLPLQGSSSNVPKYENPEIILGPPFDVVKVVLEILEAIGLAPILSLGMSNEWKLSGGFDVKLPEVELGAMKIIDVGASTEISYSLSDPSSAKVGYKVGAGLVIATSIPELYFGGTLELGIEADPVLVTSITTMAVVIFGGDFLGGKAEARAGLGVEFGFGEGIFNLYGILMLKAEIKWFKSGPLEDFIGAGFSFELKGGWANRTCPAPGGGTQSTSYMAGEVSIALEVSICWVLTISIEFSEEFVQAQGPELCPF